MFNVSALLLDDALKPATPLTNGAINEMLRHTLDISQGSVATHLRCGGRWDLYIKIVPIFGPPCRQVPSLGHGVIMVT